MLRPDFVLHRQSALVGSLDDLTRFVLERRESFAAFDSLKTERGAEVEVAGKLSLSDGDLERASPGGCLDSRVPARPGSLPRDASGFAICQHAIEILIVAIKCALCSRVTCDLDG